MVGTKIFRAKWLVIMVQKKTVRCAIYTRKSSEEGLEQDFNSLHAQREACENYIKSQKHEGWSIISTAYDDGGYSGGNLKRPSIRNLLSDIKLGLIDIVVVYKVDRLTRSLIDFAKIVEIFDNANVSFVSITQQFNTTSSMGRLTLNVLLSFAQFEREVTGERIRDKIRASKAKGMWMGGCVPFGYKALEKRLIIDSENCGLVKKIFELYLQYESVSSLQRYLNRVLVCEKSVNNIGKIGAVVSSNIMSKNKLYGILSNPIYMGKIKLGGTLVTGLHEPIISEDIYKNVQTILAKNCGKKTGKYTASNWLLKNKLFNLNGKLYVVEQIKLGNIRKYYYTNSSSVIDCQIFCDRIPCDKLENLLLKFFKDLLLEKHVAESSFVYPENENYSKINIKKIISQISFVISPRDFIERFLNKVVAVEDKFNIEVKLPLKYLYSSKLINGARDEDIDFRIIISNPFFKIRRGLKQYYRNDNQFILKWIDLARVWYFNSIIEHNESIAQIAASMNLSSDCVGNNIMLAFLSPKIIKHMRDHLSDSTFSKAKIIQIVSNNQIWSKQEDEYFKICDKN